MILRREKIKKGFLILSWALYDLANQFFLLNVVSLYFVRWVTIEKKTPEIFYTVAYGISMLLMAALAPILGTASDLTQRRRPFLVYFTLLSIIFTVFLGLSQNVFLALLFFVIANFGCQAAVVFYNALMVNIAPENRMGLVSGFGRMLAYSGAILAIYFVKPAVLKSGYQAAFLPTGILFLVFSLPCMIFVKDKESRPAIKLLLFFKKDKLIEIFRTLKITALNAYKFPGLLDFLKSMFFLLGAVNVIILFMSVYATRVFGMNEHQITNLIAFSTFFAIAGSILSGFISDYIGYQRCLCIVVVLWGVCFLLGAFAKVSYLYWLTGALAGTSLGATWTVSRALVINLVPKESVGEMFGLFNFVGYFSAILGSLFWGILLLFLSSLGEWGYRISLLSLVLFILLGLIFLLRIPKRQEA